MSPRPLLVATRNPGKLREVQNILAELSGWQIVGLNDVGIPEDPEEDGLERFATFKGNALAKARYFAGRTGMWVLAEDSGLCVDALEGAPGVRSKRFSQRHDLNGPALDRANNQLLLELLEATPMRERTARFVCAAAFVSPAGREELFQGICEGIILPEPRGSQGFGYDPLFFVPAEKATLAELDPRRKNAISHRAEAIRVVRRVLQGQLDEHQ